MSDRDEPSGGRRHKPHGIVRPYVLSAGDSAGRSQPKRDGGDSLTRHDHPAADWPGDPRSRGTHDTRFTSTRADPPIRPRPTTPQLPAPKAAGNHRRIAGRRRLPAIGIGVAALAILAGTILLLSRPSSNACSTAGCPHGTTRAFGGNPPPVDPPASRHKAIRRSHPTATARPSPAPTRTHPTPSPTKSSPAPTPTPSASPAPTQSVKVSYLLVSQHPHSFQGQFTIVNNGSTAIKGWELVIVLPNDRIHAVWDGSFHTNGDTLYIDPSKSQQTIAPGATLTENVSAHGPTATPTSCAFNGSAC